MSRERVASGTDLLTVASLPHRYIALPSVLHISCYDVKCQANVQSLGKTMLGQQPIQGLSLSHVSPVVADHHDGRRHPGCAV